ncbi:GIY-YIG nuclease family protein [Cysteiniphilum sp. QT6929]|uniref:GIY-YIG nuclease family protein n=1 Tax=Cysteiniphilum sp. QT6929 TaxID=2975055 RepID=UPI0024B35233|nr:GIY-YIG nuclease family protein [Cysteiniphilum sp. QT6929]WHN66175.1 GIY-YIG nuclease family protein [Cysteiniphilum sp. QT6929]
MMLKPCASLTLSLGNVVNKVECLASTDAQPTGNKLMQAFVYILECSDGSYYTGSTKNVELRLWEHQNGQGANHTRKRLPVKLVFVEQFDRIDEAYAREKQIQGWSRKKKEALIQGDYNQLHILSICRNSNKSKNSPEDH